jgi:hypothetical protein
MAATSGRILIAGIDGRQASCSFFKARFLMQLFDNAVHLQSISSYKKIGCSTLKIVSRVELGPCNLVLTKQI